MKGLGKIPRDYSSLEKNGNLAEYIGVVLGDGNISKFPRAERIIISANANNNGFVERYAKLTASIFNKEPTVSKINGANCIRISLYQKNISKRLKIPTGNRSNFEFKVPNWIFHNKTNILRFLRGLFEAEGSLSIHKATYTYNFSFSNKNKSLLSAVEQELRLLGFFPEMRTTSVRLRRKQEVEKFKEMIRFREY